MTGPFFMLRPLFERQIYARSPSELKLRGVHTSRDISRRRLPHRFNILGQKLSLKPRIRHLPRQCRLRHLLQEPQTAHRSLPIADVIRLDLNERHAWIIRGAVVHAVAQVSEPGAGEFGGEVFDAGVVVGSCCGGAGDGDPVLVGGVLKGDLGGFVV